MKRGSERNGDPEHCLWFEWLPVSGQACFLFSLVSAEAINFIYNSREIPHHYSTQSSGSEDCDFTMLRIQQINWILLRSGKADKGEKLHLHHLT